MNYPISPRRYDAPAQKRQSQQIRDESANLLDCGVIFHSAGPLLPSRQGRDPVMEITVHPMMLQLTPEQAHQLASWLWNSTYRDLTDLWDHKEMVAAAIWGGKKAWKSLKSILPALTKHIDETIRPGIVDDVNRHVDEAINLHEGSVRQKLIEVMSQHEAVEMERFATTASNIAKIEDTIKTHSTRLDEITDIVKSIRPMKRSVAHGD